MIARWRLPRSTEPELLDAEAYDQEALAANLRDLQLSSALLGIGALVWRAVHPFLRDPSSHTPTLLDVATGGADLPRDLAARARRMGLPLRVFASDRRREIVSLARRRAPELAIMQHDALSIPTSPASFDVVTCALAVHHFTPDETVRLFRELARVARRAVIVVDLRRSRAAYLAALLLARGPWHAMARHDGPLSVRRAYTMPEMRALMHKAGVQGGVTPAFPFLMLATLQPPSTRDSAS